MKKLFICILLLFLNFLLIVNINTYSLDTRVNSSISLIKPMNKLCLVKYTLFDFNLDGYVIKESNVDLTKEGNYKVYYQDNYTNTLYEKEVEVISKDYLINNGLYSYSDEVKGTYTYNYIDQIIVNENLKITLISLEKFNYQVIIENKNNQIITKKIFDETPCEFYKLGYFEETKEIYVAGYGFNIGSGLDCLVVKINLSGDILECRKIVGFERDIVKKVEFDGEMFWFLGLTTSSSNIFEHEKKGVDAFILGYEPIHTNMCYYLDLSKEGEDDVSYLSVNENYILSHHSTKINNQYQNFITLIDYEGNFNTFDLNIYQKLEILDYIQLNDNLYFLGKVINNNIEENYLIKLNQVFGVEIINGYFQEKENEIEKSYNQLQYLNNQLYIFYSNVNQNNIIYQIYDLDKKKITFENEIKTIDPIDKLIIKENNLIEYYTNHEIHQYKFEYLTFIDNCFYIDNKILKPIKETIKDENHFGKYDSIYEYQMLNFDFYYDDYTEVPLTCNICDDNTYQLKYEINTNAVKIYLDEIEIENGYLINQLGGNHQLRLVGNYTDDVIINFKVVDVLSKQEKTKTINNFEYEFNEIKASNDEENIIKINDGELIENINSKNTHETLWYLLIPLLSVLLTIFCYIMVGKKS